MFKNSQCATNYVVRIFETLNFALVAQWKVSMAMTISLTNDNFNDTGNVDQFSHNFRNNFTVMLFTVQRRGAITNESAAGISKYLSFASALFKATIFVIL